MPLKPAIKSLRIQNLFSFGETTSPIELGPLNILIGPNASGKSNFIAVIGLLKGIPKDFADAISDAGGISECLWKGLPTTPTALLEVVANPRHLKTPVRYQVSFTRKLKKSAIVSESLTSDGERTPRLLFEHKNGRSVLYRATGETLGEDETGSEQSILSRLQDSKNYPEITYLGRLFRAFRLYSDWEFGQTSKVRDSYQAEAKNDFLEEDISNLGLMLNRWLSDTRTQRIFLRPSRVGWSTFAWKKRRKSVFPPLGCPTEPCGGWPCSPSCSIRRRRRWCAWKNRSLACTPMPFACSVSC